MRLFVTGISGFVGRRLARCLLAAGDRVEGSYTGKRPELPGAPVHEVDVLEGEAMGRIVDRFDPDAVVHLAGLSHVGASWQDLPGYFRVNLLGTETVLDACRGRRFVFASSAEVYGRVPEDRQPIAEDCPLAPPSPYALTKAAAERLAAGRGAVIARSFNLVGPGQAATFALPAFAGQLAAIARGEAEPVLRVGNLSAKRDFVHVDDGARAYRLLAERGEPGTAYNIASGRADSVAELLERLMEVSGVEARVEVDPERMRPVDLPLLAGAPGRLEALGWHRELGVEAALKDLWSSLGPGPGTVTG